MKKRIAYLLIFLLIMGSATYASIDSKIKDNQNKLKEIQKSLKDVDQARKENKTKQSQLEKDINALQEEIRIIEDKLSELSSDIEMTEKAIDIKSDELIEAEKDVAYQNDRMQKRLRTMYKARNYAYFEIVLGAHDFSDMMTRLDKIQLLLGYDNDTLKELIEVRLFVEKTKENLEQKKTELELLKNEQVIVKLHQESKVNEIKDKKAELNKDLIALENQLDELNEDAKFVTKVIKKLKIQKNYVGGKMMWPLPLRYTRISSPFGYRIHPVLKKKKMHTGIDIPAPRNTSVYAAGHGTVIYADWLGSYGKAVMIDHGGGIVTLYGHNNKLVVKVGKKVKKGDVISKVGTTGRSTGNHVHFEVRKNGKYVNPLGYVKSKK